MKTEYGKQGKISNIAVKPYLYAMVIIIGAALKFYGINERLFWVDEVYSVLYTGGGVKQQIAPINEVKHITYYDSLLHLTTQPLVAGEQVTSIFNDTHITPAHYVFLIFWYRIAGDEPVDYRLFSVLIFFACLPLVFLLCSRMFSSSLAGWIGCALFAISPFIQMYAQEARYYQLWVFTFLLCNYTLIEAVKNNNRLWWLAYLCSAALALYTSSLSALILFGHGIFLLRYHKTSFKAYCISAGIAGLLYSPWLLYLYTTRSTISEGLSWHLDKTDGFNAFELLLWIVIGSLKYFSFPVRLKEYDTMLSGNISASHYTALVADLIILVLIVYAIYYLLKKGRAEIAWFLLLLLIPQYLTFFVSDLIRNSHTVYFIRYQITGMVGLSFIVTYLIYHKIESGSRWFGAVFLIVAMLGLVSIFQISRNSCWTTRPDCEANIYTADLLTSASHPLVITDFGRRSENFLVVMNKTRNKNLEVLYSDKRAERVLNVVAKGNYDVVYVVHASDSLLFNLENIFNDRLQLQQNEKNKALQVWRIDEL